MMVRGRCLLTTNGHKYVLHVVSMHTITHRILCLTLNGSTYNFFFTDLEINNTIGAEKYFWVNTILYGGLLENFSFTAMDLYMNMSYQLKTDINIFLYHFSVQ